MNQEPINYQQSKYILSELDSIAATAQMFIEQYYRIRKKLESIHSPASTRKGKKALQEQLINQLWANRLKTINRQIMKNT